MTPPPSGRGLSLKEVVRFIITWLTGAARKKEWGQLTITVQAGQVVFVTEQKSHRDRLPDLVAMPAETTAGAATV
jgi:hypothetical protein